MVNKKNNVSRLSRDSNDSSLDIEDIDVLELGEKNYYSDSETNNYDSESDNKMSGGSFSGPNIKPIKPVSNIHAGSPGSQHNSGFSHPQPQPGNSVKKQLSTPSARTAALTREIGSASPSSQAQQINPKPERARSLSLPLKNRPNLPKKSSSVRKELSTKNINPALTVPAPVPVVPASAESVEPVVPASAESVEPVAPVAPVVEETVVPVVEETVAPAPVVEQVEPVVAPVEYLNIISDRPQPVAPVKYLNVSSGRQPKNVEYEPAYGTARPSAPRAPTVKQTQPVRTSPTAPLKKNRRYYKGNRE